METLKNTLKRKLHESKHLQNDLEAQPRGADFVTKAKVVDGWYNAWVRDAFQEKFNALGSTALFFINKPKHIIASSSNSDLHRLVQREARNKLFMKRDLLSLHGVEVNMLEKLLCRNSSNWSSSQPPSPARPIDSPGESMLDIPVPLDQMISLAGYQKAVREFADYLKVTRQSNGFLSSDSLWVMKWFTIKLYVKLSKQENDGLVPVSSIMQYVHKKLHLYQLRLELMKYDSEGTGYFSKEQLVLYLNRLWSNYIQGREQKEFIRVYIDSIVAETFFLLDPHRTSKIKIAELLGSQLLHQIRYGIWDNQMHRRFSNKLFIFKELLGNSVNQTIPIAIFCEKLPEISEQIWRSDERVEEKRVRFTQSILQRLIHFYEPSGSKNNKENMGVSFSTFLDITYAWEHLGTCLSSISFFFRALDTDDKGYLDDSDLQRHYRNIEELLKLKIWRRRYSHSPRSKNDRSWITPSFIQIQTQIKDILVREGIPVSRITPENLYKAKDGHVLIASLINVETSLNNTFKWPISSSESTFFRMDLEKQNYRRSF